MIWETFANYDALSARASDLMLEAIRSNPALILGLPTGRTPIGMYQRVIAGCTLRYHCFQDVQSFNLDEYLGIPRDHPGSYFRYMKKQLFDHVDIDPKHTHILDGATADPMMEARRYERAIAETGGLGLTFLGLGTNGHIGFNEPGTPFDSRTRVVELSQSTRVANAALFPDGNVPTRALTMGIATILESRRIVLLANGDNKRAAIGRLMAGGPADISFPASALIEHPDVRVLTA